MTIYIIVLVTINVNSFFIFVRKRECFMMFWYHEPINRFVPVAGTGTPGGMIFFFNGSGLLFDGTGSAKVKINKMFRQGLCIGRFSMVSKHGRMSYNTNKRIQE